MHGARIAALFCIAGVGHAALADPTSPPLRWQVVVNNNDTIPGSDRNFNSYNQPSVNSRGRVVFRARSRGADQGPLSGIFVRDLSRAKQPIRTLADRQTSVPQPNNTEYPDGSGILASFNEFPAFPRIAPTADLFVTRGNSQPVWTYTPDGEAEETRLGTSGVYLYTEDAGLVAGATQLGAVPGFEQYQVPGSGPGTRFDQFPGAPSVTDDGVVVFKGNFTDQGVAATGVFFREPLMGDVSIQRIASTATRIPGSANYFGSTAPPTAAAGQVVFVGVDNEEEPSEGGIYLAPLSADPVLSPLVAIGDAVPGTTDATFSRFGEGLSFDGRFVAFWGAWGEETRTLRLYCPEEGNRDRIDFCNNVGGNGDSNSVCDASGCYQDKSVPVHQGIFVLDTQEGLVERIASTPEDYADFLYWNYSGAPPGDGHDGEPPRWRASAFVAAGGPGTAVRVAWKARQGEFIDGRYVDPIDGIYLRSVKGRAAVLTVVDTTTPGPVIDRQAPGDSLVSEIGLERDALRGTRLVISAAMVIPGGEESDGMAGIYLTRVR